MYVNQNLGNAIIGDCDLYTAQASRAIRQLAKTFPGFPTRWRPTVQSQLTSLVRDLHAEATAQVPKCLHHDNLANAAKELRWRFVLLPLDKNNGKPVLICKKLFARLVVDTYSDTTQFNEVKSCGTHKEALKEAKSMLHEYAVQCGVEQHFDVRKYTQVPESFIFIKNTSCEENCTLKLRVLFSFFRHPMKRFGKKVGCCLNMMIKNASSLFPTIAINKTNELMEWVQNTNTQIAAHYEHTPARTPQRNRFKFWELDVLEMFPRLPRGKNPHAQNRKKHPPGVWDTVKQLHALYTDSSRLRVPSDGIHFALHEHREFDLMRQAYGPGYDCVKWSSILPYLHFEIFYNDLFVVSNKIYKQKQGVAIGGT